MRLLPWPVVEIGALVAAPDDTWVSTSVADGALLGVGLSAGSGPVRIEARGDDEFARIVAFPGIVSWVNLPYTGTLELRPIDGPADIIYVVGRES